MRIQALPYMGGLPGKAVKCSVSVGEPALVSFIVSGPHLANKYQGLIAASTTYLDLPLPGAGPYIVVMGLSASSSMSWAQSRTVNASNAVVTYIPIYFPSPSLAPTMIVRVPENDSAATNYPSRGIAKNDARDQC
jgi:hypothetical protein